MTERVYTKPAMKLISLRVKLSDIDLLRTAAAQKEVSQSEFLREALREKAGRVLLQTELREAQ